MKKSDFYYDLPEELIAQTPVAVSYTHLTDILLSLMKPTFQQVIIWM